MLEPWILLIFAVLMGLAGFVWLALAMDIHWKKVQAGHNNSIHPVKALRIMGWAGLSLSAVLCFMADRPSMAVLVWIMLLAATAPSVGMMLSWRPRLLRFFWPLP